MPGGRQDVVLFERNGLRHREFTLQAPDGGLPECRVRDMLWNCDSSILAIQYGHDFVELWTSINYHWSRKIVVNGVVTMKWDAERPLSFKYASTSGQVKTITLLAMIDTNASCKHGNTAPVCFVEGATLKVTSVRLSNIPHPMSMH